MKKKRLLMKLVEDILDLSRLAIGKTRGRSNLQM